MHSFCPGADGIRPDPRIMSLDLISGEHAARTSICDNDCCGLVPGVKLEKVKTPDYRELITAITCQTTCLLLLRSFSAVSWKQIRNEEAQW